MSEQELKEWIQAGFDRIDRRFDQVDQRIDKVDQRFDTFEQRIDQRFTDLRNELDSRFGAVHQELNLIYKMAHKNGITLERLSSTLQYINEGESPALAERVANLERRVAFLARRRR